MFKISSTIKKTKEYRPKTTTINDKAKIFIPEHIHDAIFKLADRDLEWTLYGKIKMLHKTEFIIEDIIVPKQKNSSSESTISAEDMAEWQMRKYYGTKNEDDICGPEWSAWIHSHNSMGAFWSKTDKNNMELLVGERQETNHPIVCIVVSSKKDAMYEASILYPDMNLSVDALVYSLKQDDVPDKPKNIIEDIQEESDWEIRKDELKRSILYYNNFYEKIDKEITEKEIKTTIPVYGYNYNGNYCNQQQLGFTNNYYDSLDNIYQKKKEKKTNDSKIKNTQIDFEDSILAEESMAHPEDMMYYDDNMIDYYIKDKGYSNRSIVKFTDDNIYYNEPGYYVCNKDYSIQTDILKDNDGEEYSYLRLLDIDESTVIEDIYDRITKEKLTICYFDYDLNPLWEMVPSKRKYHFELSNKDKFTTENNPYYYNPK